MQKADLQPVPEVTTNQLAVDEKVIRVHGQQYWLYGAVDPETNEIPHVRLFPTTTKQTTRWFLAELHHRYRLDGVTFLVDDAESLVGILRDDGYRFQITSTGNRNAIERILLEVGQGKYSLLDSFIHVERPTAQAWLEVLTVHHESRQTSATDTATGNREPVDRRPAGLPDDRSPSGVSTTAEGRAPARRRSSGSSPR